MKKFLSYISAIILGLIMSTAASGQVPQPMTPAVLGGFATLSVTASSSRVALGASVRPFGALTIFNKGDKDAFVRLGTSSVTATTSTTPVPAGKGIVIWVPDTTVTHIAGICGGSDTTSLVIYSATGFIGFGP